MYLNLKCLESLDDIHYAYLNGREKSASLNVMGSGEALSPLVSGLTPEPMPYLFIQVLSVLKHSEDLSLRLDILNGPRYQPEYSPFLGCASVSV